LTGAFRGEKTESDWRLGRKNLIFHRGRKKAGFNPSIREKGNTASLLRGSQKKGDLGKAVRKKKGDTHRGRNSEKRKVG